jgi:hypothetical protein
LIQLVNGLEVHQPGMVVVEFFAAPQAERAKLFLGQILGH